MLFSLALIFLCGMALGTLFQHLHLPPLLGTALTRRERLFCMLAYCPKATVQAAIGSSPWPWDSPAAAQC
jgi:hypothetical protein